MTLEAIYRISPVNSFTDFPDFMRNMAFAYLFEVRGNKIVDKILRLDLFRKIDTDASGSTFFTGGVLHLLNHFRYKGNPLSTAKKENNELQHPSFIMRYIIEGFFFHEFMSTVKKDCYSTRIRLNDNRFLKFIFYYEIVSRIYFINTVHRDDSKK